MICPDCKAENIEGVDLCESCGADLRNLKPPPLVFEPRAQAEPPARLRRRAA